MCHRGGKDLPCSGQEHPDPDKPRENPSCTEERGPPAAAEPLAALVLHRSRLRTSRCSSHGPCPVGCAVVIALRAEELASENAGGFRW